MWVHEIPSEKQDLVEAIKTLKPFSTFYISPLENSNTFITWDPSRLHPHWGRTENIVSGCSILTWLTSTFFFLTFSITLGASLVAQIAKNQPAMQETWAWWTTVHGVAKSQTWPRDWTPPPKHQKPPSPNKKAFFHKSWKGARGLRPRENMEFPSPCFLKSRLAGNHRAFSKSTSPASPLGQAGRLASHTQQWTQNHRKGARSSRLCSVME